MNEHRRRVTLFPTPPVPPSSAPYAEDSVAASGPVWAPAEDGCESAAVVCPVWAGDIDNFKSTSRRLGLVFCFNRPSAMYLVQAPVVAGEGAEAGTGAGSDAANEDLLQSHPIVDDLQSHPIVDDDGGVAEAEAVLLTPGTKSALWPRFSPDGTTLVFVSHDCAVESGAHMATAALHAIPWTVGITAADAVAAAAAAASSRVVVPAVDAPATEGAFPGLYMFSPPPAEPWIKSGGGESSDGLLLQSTWGAGEAIVHVNVETGRVTRVTPPAAAGEGTWVGAGDDGSGGGGSWGLLDVRDGVVAAMHSTPASTPRVHVAWVRDDGGEADGGGVALSHGGWTPVQSSYKGAAAAPAMSAIANLEYHVTTVLRDEEGGGAATVQSITVRPKSSDEGGDRRQPLPTIILPHGGPHASCAAGYVATVAFLASLGYAVVYCNYRGSTGYGERALRSLVGGAAGTQDVSDCVKIAETAIAEGVADPDRVCVVGGSHGGFLGGGLLLLLLLFFAPAHVLLKVHSH